MDEQLKTVDVINMKSQSSTVYPGIVSYDMKWADNNTANEEANNEYTE